MPSLAEIQAGVMTAQGQLQALRPTLDEWGEFLAHNATLLPVHCKNAGEFLESILVPLSLVDSYITLLPVYQVRDVITNPNPNMGLIAALDSLKPIVMGTSDGKRILRYTINGLFQKLQNLWSDMLAEFQVVYGY